MKNILFDGKPYIYHGKPYIYHDKIWWDDKFHFAMVFITTEIYSTESLLSKIILRYISCKWKTCYNDSNYLNESNNASL